MSEKIIRVKRRRFNSKPYQRRENFKKQIKLVVEAFHGLPGPKSRLFMGFQATELNHFTKPFKMGLQLTNHHFNFDKFRVSMSVTVNRSAGHAKITWIGVAYLMKAG